MSNIQPPGSQQQQLSSVASTSSVVTPTNQTNNLLNPTELNHQTFQAWIDLLVDTNVTDDVKIKTLQDLSLHLETMQALPTYSQLIDYAMEIFIRVLTETEPQFIAESILQQQRKKILEIIQRITSVLTNNYLNSEQRSDFVKRILNMFYGLIEKENEENVVICLKIITDYHRLLKALITTESQQFFNFIKKVYSDLPKNISIVFNHKSIIKLAELNESNLERMLNETYSSVQIHTEKTPSNQNYTILPRGVMSLKVLAECPLTTVMIYNYNKDILNQEIVEIIPLVANVVALQPSDEQRLASDNQEVYADFVTAQVKALSFIAFFKSHKDYLIKYSDYIVTGIMQLLKNCPPEVVNVRKDLLAISRHLIGDLRSKFLPYLNQFFDETSFCSTGYTASESLRTSACSIVVDYVHNVRKQLSYPELCKAINYFSKSLHDPLLHINLQQMCCRVLLTLIDCIKAKDPENLFSREIILKLFEVIVLKFKSIAIYQVTHLLEANNSTPSTPVSNQPSELSKEIEKELITNVNLHDKKGYIEKLDIFLNSFEDKDRVKLKYGPSSVIILNESDCRAAIRFLILASRNITGFLIDSKLASNEITPVIQPKQLTPRETFMYVKFLKNALLSLDIYMVGRSTKTNTNLTQKEEKEVIESLGTIFSYLHSSTLTEIFTQTIDFIIERTFKNPNIYMLSSYFLATPTTSCTFATILIEYLLKKMEQMGDSSVERSNLYLKLFKLVFGSVSVLAAENEKMLKPHLHSLVTKSLEYALKAKEPYNYFLLLRALFRSIGGGNHDLLYQEFLPLLPVLLQNLNELQTGLHKQQLKDLFVELCLTVPVRLSSLLPYLPMLMDPLVSALNGSPTLISQGLRTLELCVDNLQADFLYDHIQPVQTDLIQGLWRNIRSPSDSIAHVAYRVLGKLGGTNRKMITEPQKLKYNINSNDCKEFNGPTIKVSFPNYSSNIEVSLEKVLESCENILKNTNSELFYKKHAFKIVSSFIGVLLTKETDKQALNNFYTNYNPINSSQFTQYLIKTLKFDDEYLRQTVELSLSCIYYASTVKEIKSQVLALLDSLVVHFTLISLSHYNNQDEMKINTLIQSNVFTQCAIPNANTPTTSNLNANNSLKMTNASNLNINAINQYQSSQTNYLDFMIIIDALFKVLSNDDMEYWLVGQRSLLIMIETSEIVSGGIHLNDNKQCDSYLLRSNLANNALFDYLAEKVSHLCYERSWYAKKAGCQMIKLLCKKLPLVWVISNCFMFVRSIIAILISVMGEISSGAIDIAQENLELLIGICLTKLPSQTATLSVTEQNMLQKLNELQQKTLADVLKELIRQITSSNIYVRKESIKLIKQIAELQTKSIYQLILPFSDILFETVAPRKHCKLRHYTTQSQIGILEGIEFCSSTQPQLFTLNMSNPDHLSLFQEIIPICEGNEDQLAKNSCYKNTTDLTPLRKAALNTLASFYQLLEQRETILSTLHRALASPSQEIQQTSFSCLKKFNSNTELYAQSLRQAAQATPSTPNPALENLKQTMQIAADYLKDYLNQLNDYLSLNLNVLQHLSYITQLYPTILNEKFSEYLLTHLKNWLENVYKLTTENTTTNTATSGTDQTISNSNKPVTNELKICAAIISLLAELQSAPAKLVDTAIGLVLKYERLFMLEVNSQFRSPLSNLLKRYPVETLKYLLNLERIKDPYFYRFVIYLIKKQPAFSIMFKRDTNRLIQMANESQVFLNNALNPSNTMNANDLIATSNQIQYLAILIFYRLSKLDTENQWILNQATLVNHFVKIWCDDRFHEKHKSIDQLDYIYWKEPIYLVKIFLKFHKAQLDLYDKYAANTQMEQTVKLYPQDQNIELLFKLLIAFQNKSLQQYEFLRIYFRDTVTKVYSCDWKRAAFFKFVQIFNQGKQNETTEMDTSNTEPQQETPPPLSKIEKPYIYSQKLKANILQYILIPCFQYCFENNQHVQLIGSPPQPDTDSDDNIISVFINKVVDPDANNISDSIRIFLLQLSSLFVQYAHDHIHDVNNKRQGTKLRRLMTFAWPCVLPKTCVDPFYKYHGHLLLSYIISKFAIHKRIVQQVFHSLLKAHAPEAKIVVRQALEILTPSFPTRMEDGYYTLATYTKKILTEENNVISQLAHMLYIIVKYHKVYYLIRHSLITHLTTSFQKVSLSANAQPENKQLAIDLTEIILRWEVQRVRDVEISKSTDQSGPIYEQRVQIETLKLKHPDMLKPFEKNVADILLYFFVRTACPVNDPMQQQQQQQSQQSQQQQPQQTQQQQTEALTRRCFYLFQMAISNETWPYADIKYEYLDKILSTLESVNNQTANANTAQIQPNYNSICTCIEMIIFLVENSSASRPKMQSIFRSVQRGLTACIMSNNSRVVKAVGMLVQKIMSLIPVEHFNNNPNSINATIASTAAAVTTSPNTSLSTPILSGQSNETTSLQQNDSIYYLFGQPDGILCKKITDDLSLYEKAATNLNDQSNQSNTSNNSVDILTNCLLLLKSASAHNPQYIDRLMVPFMKILQKLYKDHLNATAMATASATAHNVSLTQVNASSTSLENSNYIQLPNTSINAFSELLIQSLDLIKFRIGVMSSEMRKVFINSILVTLIEKSIDLRLIRYLVKLISDWIKYNKNGTLINQIPSLKEKLTLLQRLTISIEKRFSEHADLQQIFLETIAYVYKDEVYSTNNEFKIKLEQAFLAGLKSTNPQIRQMFFDIFNTTFNSTDLFERLCYVIVTQNWESFGTHYWIKQCIQMTLGACATADQPVQFSDITANRFKFVSLLNTETIGQVQQLVVAAAATAQSELTPTNTVLNKDSNLMIKNLWIDEDETSMLVNPDVALDSTDFLTYVNKKFLNIYTKPARIDLDETSERTATRDELINILNENQLKLFNHCSEIRNDSIIVSLCQLCHSNNELAHQIWIQLFIQMFNLLSPKQQQNLYGELTPFVASGSHILQKQCQLSTLNTFIESFAMAKPVSLFLRPSLLAYLAKNHNLWHRVILLLENSLSATTELSSNQLLDSNSNQLNESASYQQQQQNALQNVQHETFSSLSQLYSQLKEDDYRAGLWHKRAMHENTRIAIMYEQQGLFYQAQKLYEEIIARAVDVYVNEPSLTNPDELLEFNLWEERWIKCCKELNQWTELNDYCQSKESDFALNLECAWKQPNNDWQTMKTLLQTPQKDINLPKEISWRWPLYQGYYLVCNPEDYSHLMMITANSTSSSSILSGNQQQLVISASSAVESKVERCMYMALKEWRRLPRLVAPIHTTLLQAAQQIVELQEAFQIQNNLLILTQLQGATSTNSSVNPQTILQEIKAVIKTWRARLPLISDDLSYWNDIFTWRQFHYESFTRFYDRQQQLNGTGANPAMLGVHALAQGIVHFGKIARKQHLYDLCLETLNKIHKRQSVPVIDCFLKVKQEIKCYINTFDYLSRQQSQELLEVIEATNLRYFTKENVAELISLKAHFLQLCGKYDDANHLYSFSIYLNDSQPRLWGAWGDYLTQAYVNVSSPPSCLNPPNSNPFAKRSIDTAESALIALLHAARHPNSECKARKFIAKILWLLTYDNERRQLFSIFDMYSTQIPAANWINWIPQLITLLVKNDDTGKYIINLMHQICRQYPLALYYPLRSLYLKLKSEENTEKYKLQLQLQQQQQQQHQQNSNGDTEMKDSPSTPRPSQPLTISSSTTESLIRVTKLMHSQREMHPTLFNTLENLIDQLLWLKVNWFEESLRNFKQTLFACYNLLFEHINAYVKSPRPQQMQPIHEYCIDPFSIIWFKRLFKFYYDTTYFNRNVNTAANQANQNQRVRSILAVFNDPSYLITRDKFQQDFNYQLTSTQRVNVFSMISKLKSWIKLFELYLKTSPKQQLLEERLKYVTQFCSSTADIEIPGEFLIPRHTNYYVKISKFLPKSEWVEKYNAYSRRISIRGHNGKIYPFLISNESNYYDSRKEEHILQLMRMINTYMSKQKETSRRNLHFCLPRIVSLSNEVRMVEDDCSAVGLLDIYKNTMRKLSMHKALSQHSNNKNTNKNQETTSSHSQKILSMSEAGELPLARYFERVQMASSSMSASASAASSSNSGSTQMPAINKQFFVDLYKHIASTLLPKTLLKEWAIHTYSDATDYFHFRKLFTSQLAIFGLIEYACCLTRLNPDQFYLSQSTGTCQSIRLKFDLNEVNQTASNVLNSSVNYYQQITDFNGERPVPFRLSPNISEFITSAGISGLMSAIQIALARCLVQPQYQFSWILRAILKDEILTCISRKKQDEIMRSSALNSSNNNANTTNSASFEQEAEALINLVNKLVAQIETRVKDCASLEGGKNFIINELIPKAMNIENLSQMDPLWYPWL